MALIKVMDVTKDPIFVTHRDGVKIYDQICSHLDKGENVTLSFEGVEIMTASFLTPAIGDLYGKYDEIFINEHLKTTDMPQVFESYLNLVITEAKLYFEDPERYIQERDELLEEID